MSAAAAQKPDAPDRPPLALDMDGTLLRTDALMETLVAFLKRNPLNLLLVVWWLASGGRALLKRALAARTAPDVATWPVNETLVAYAEAEAARGRPVALATASDEAIARRVAARFPFIGEVLASDGRVNLKSRNKAKALALRYPEGFTYAGDSRADLAVWRAARGAIHAGAREGVKRAAARAAPLEADFPTKAGGLRAWTKALRLHQWAKNALLFVPLVLGGRAGELDAWIACGLGFLGMGLVASGSYLINDLLDVEDDRRHWSKRNRPFASGALPLAQGLLAAPLAIAAGLALGFAGGGALGALALGLYLAVTLSYSLGLKRVAMLDAFLLATLFTGRLGMGIVFAEVAASPWLLVFSMFLFTSLSLAKRTTEIKRMREHGHERALGRGYVAADLPTVAGLGAASAVAAVLLMVLYLTEEAFGKAFYAQVAPLWALPALLSLWLARVWLLCGRGELEDDPVAFAVKDRMSLLLAFAMGASFLAALAPLP